MERRGRGGRALALWAAWLLLAAPAGCGGSGEDADVDGSPDDAGDGSPDSGADGDGDADTDPDGSPSECGDGVVDPGEECDGHDLGEGSCETLGLPPGTLTCTEGCRWDVSGCARCGDGSCDGGETATDCPEDCGVVSVAAGTSHTCAVLEDGTVRCWGARSGHRMGGVGDVRRPVALSGLDDAVAVAVGEAHGCVLRAGGAVSCWGRNRFGETGTGGASAELFPPAPVVVSRDDALEPLEGATAIAAGRFHGCVVAGGALGCWGRGDATAIGGAGLAEPADWPMRPRNPIASLGPDQGMVALALGEGHGCVTAGGSVACWGDNRHGQAGTLTRRWPASPTSVIPGFTVALGAGDSHSCATVVTPPHMPLSMSGLFCWGSNAHGQLGAPASLEWSRPTRVSVLAAEVIVGGSHHSCVLESVPGTPLCWGSGLHGQLGDGAVESRHEPRPVAGLEDATALAAGTHHTCAIRSDRTLRCWGRNDAGQLGIDSTDPVVPSPVQPVGL